LQAPAKVKERIYILFNTQSEKWDGPDSVLSTLRITYTKGYL